MAVAQQKGYPWATGAVGVQPFSGQTGNVRIFSAKGISAPGLLGTSPLPQIGTLIAGTPFVYVRPRLTQDPLGGVGGSTYVPFAFPGGGPPPPRSLAYVAAMIKYTNPEYSMYAQDRRTASIGMAAAGSVGATMDVPYQSEVPYFSVP
jgi:hypothetical protein